MLSITRKLRRSVLPATRAGIVATVVIAAGLASTATSSATTGDEVASQARQAASSAQNVAQPDDVNFCAAWINDWGFYGNWVFDACFRGQFGYYVECVEDLKIGHVPQWIAEAGCTWAKD